MLTREPRAQRGGAQSSTMEFHAPLPQRVAYLTAADGSVSAYPASFDRMIHSTFASPSARLRNQWGLRLSNWKASPGWRT